VSCSPKKGFGWLIDHKREDGRIVVYALFAKEPQSRQIGCSRIATIILDYKASLWSGSGFVPLMFKIGGRYPLKIGGFV
jgi:hypothetical protein